MKNINNVYKPKLITLSLLLSFSTSCLATDSISIDSSNQIEQINNQSLIDQAEQQNSIIDQQLLNKVVDTDDATTLVLPSKQQSSHKKITKEETLEEFKKNPKALEYTLALMIKSSRVDEVEEILPLYKKYHKNIDGSLVLWADALINQKYQKYDESVASFKKLVEQFPKVKILRFQYAVTLLRNKQDFAAKTQLQYLKRDKRAEKADIKVISQLLDKINKIDKWRYNASASYTKNDNLTNSAKEGVEYGNGYKANARSEGHGIRYSISAKKRNSKDTTNFSEFSSNAYGTYYWDNKKFNRLNNRFMYKIAGGTINRQQSFQPYVSTELYGGGQSSKDNGLKYHKTTFGLMLEATDVLSSKTNLINSLNLSRDIYIKDFQNNNNTSVTVNNGLVHNINPISYIYTGLETGYVNSDTNYQSNKRMTASVGYGRGLPYGFRANTKLRYSYVSFNTPDFFGNVRKNKTVGGSFSLLNKNIQYKGFTPQFNLSFYDTSSNVKYEERDGISSYINIVKAF